MTTVSCNIRFTRKSPNMKPLFTFLLSLFASTNLLAQGTITGFSTVPANPTIADNVEVHVDVQFTSGDCQVDNQGDNVNGFSVSAYAHHCVGMLTVICPTTDVFQLGQLPAGDYTFDFTLTSGFGGAGCSPGIIADDSDQFQFTVSSTVGVDEVEFESNLIYPNPAADMLFFKKSLKEAAIITDVQGNVVMQIPQGKSSIEIAQLSSGVYFFKHGTKQLKLIKD